MTEATWQAPKIKVSKCLLIHLAGCYDNLLSNSRIISPFWEKEIPAKTFLKSLSLING